ncbi:MAG TPA: HAMP domain-containing sensor histidine kinase [Kofleriaceae bacterium]|nr:HAMP domain-containing sensor histidine kinase [Kofleriaceae bacterium]
MESPAHRPKLWFGIWSGYAIAACFAMLCTLIAVFDPTPLRWVFIPLVGGKLLTNTLAWLALRRGRLVLSTQMLNTSIDIVVLTGGIYFTGGPYSPLLASYVIVVAVLSLLSNLGVTVLCVGLIIVSYAAMLGLMAAGVLPPMPVLGGPPGGSPSAGYALVSLTYCVVVVGVPAFFSAATLRVLRSREADLQTRTSQLVHAASQRSQFLASMTHELRTPIHGVQGLADVIAAGVYGPVTDKQKDACASIKRSAQQLLQLVDDVLQLARAEAGKIDARPSQVDVRELLERVTASVSWMVGTKRLELSVDIPEELPPVESDERWLAHVLVNLIANAVKFTPEGGRVTVSARRRDAAVELAVEDTGIGIAPEDQRVIFEPFRQGDHGDERRYGGVGLGLALVARLCELLACEVAFESAVGKGTTFRVVVPEAWRGRLTTAVPSGRAPSVASPR